MIGSEMTKASEILRGTRTYPVPSCQDRWAKSDTAQGAWAGEYETC